MYFCGMDGPKLSYPTYKVLFDPANPEEGVDAIALVDKGAIESDWVHLRSADGEHDGLRVAVQFKKQAKQILVGAALIPNKRVFQREADGKLYELLWSPEAVVEAYNRWTNDPNRKRALNLMHTDKSVPAEVTQSWLTSENDVATAVGLDLPPGTWCIAVHIADPAFWTSYIETGALNGFSIEGYLTREYLSQRNAQPMADKIEQAADSTALFSTALRDYGKALVEQSATHVELKDAADFIEEALDALEMQRVLNRLKKMGKARPTELAELYDALRAENGFEYFRQKKGKIVKLLETAQPVKQATQTLTPIEAARAVGKATATKFKP